MRATDDNIFRWKLRARSEEYKRRLKYATDAIHCANSKAKMVLSWSAGKDSTAMTHLVKSLYPNTPIMMQIDDCDWPSKIDYATRVMSSNGWHVEFVEPRFSVFERMDQGRIGQDDFCSTSHPLTRESFIEPLTAKQQELGCNGLFLGLRAEESKARKAHLSSRKEVHKISSGEIRCCPLARWSAADVFAYHIDHDIEINPCYLNNRLFPPEKIRLSWAVPTPTGLSHGEMEHMRLYFPSQFQRLRDRGVC